MSRFYSFDHTHFICFQSLAQQIQPLQATENTEDENDQNQTIVARVMATETVTEVATLAAFGTTNTPTPPVESPLLDFDAFWVAPKGSMRSEVATRVAMGQAVKTIIDAILSAGTTMQQSLALHRALLHPSMNPSSC